MELVVVLRKEVADEAAAQAMVNNLKDMLSGVSDLDMQSQTTKQYEPVE